MTELCVHPKRQRIALASRPSLYRVYFVLFLLLFCFLKMKYGHRGRVAVIWKLGSGVPLCPIAMRFVK